MKIILKQKSFFGVCACECVCIYLSTISTFCLAGNSVQIHQYFLTILLVSVDIWYKLINLKTKKTLNQTKKTHNPP